MSNPRTHANDEPLIPVPQRLTIWTCPRCGWLLTGIGDCLETITCPECVAEPKVCMPRGFVPLGSERAEIAEALEPLLTRLKNWPALGGLAGVRHIAQVMQGILEGKENNG